MIARAALAALAATIATAHAAAPVSWEATITIADLARAQAEVVWTARGLAGPVGVCVEMDGAAKYVHELRDGDRPLAADPDDEDCFRATAVAGAPLTLRYRYDLGGLASDENDVDMAVRSGDDLIFDDRVLLLRPDPLPAGAPVEVEFHLPPGVSVAGPWPRVPGAAPRFRYDAEQYQSGAYVALGKLAPLGEFPVAGGVVALTVFDRPFGPARATLTSWVLRAIAMVADFYRELPGRRVHVLLCPIARSDEPGVFGTVLRGTWPSVVLFFGGRAPDASFADEWVSAHELFHLGNPMVKHRFPWFTEGFTTYYEHVIRARRSPQTSAARWGDLAEGLRKHCDPEHGRSLSDESDGRHNFGRIYWGGACLAFRLDLAIRVRSAGQRSLDDLMRDLRRRGMQSRLDEDEVVEALDRAAGTPLLSNGLAATKKLSPSLAELLRQLGVESHGDRPVRFHDDAPLAPIRRAMF